jgi:putative ABC transport system permease protein
MFQGMPVNLVCCENLPRYSVVSPDYFRAMGMRLVAGQTFQTSNPNSPNIPAIVNSALVREYFAGENAVGKILVQESPRPSYEIVGVIDDVRQAGLDSNSDPEIYFDMRFPAALRQRNGSLMPVAEVTFTDENGGLYFAVRTRDNPASQLVGISSLVRQIDPLATIELEAATMDERLSTSVARPRFYAVLLGIFAAVAVTIAAIGVYAIVAYAVTQRTFEIGIRMALGAQPRAVIALMLKQGVSLTLAGIGLGLIGAAMVTRYLSAMLYGLTPTDPGTFITAALLFAVIAGCACYVPARRAAAVDPLLALKK